MLASNDSILRVFDTQLKKISTYSVHNDAIIYLEKLTTDGKIKVINALISIISHLLLAPMINRSSFGQQMKTVIRCEFTESSSLLIFQ